MSHEKRKKEIEDRIKTLRERGHDAPVHEALKEAVTLLNLDIKIGIGDVKMDISGGCAKTPSTWESLQKTLGAATVARIKDVGEVSE